MTKSFLRREEYRELATLTIDGAILDIGGSTASGYHELIKGNHTFTTANLDATTGATLLFNAEETWPVGDGQYDAVLLINVLEHLYRYDVAVREAHRVLKPEGRVIGVVPFMFNVHASPNDYFRYTKSTLERIFKDQGFTDVTIRELGTGAFSVVYHALIGFVRFEWFATPLIAFCRGLDHLVAFLKPNNKLSATYMPLGYYFEVRK